MTSFRLKQMGLALCLMASMLVGNGSAGVCSHHDVTKGAENDHHSHNESVDDFGISKTDDAVNDSCICVVEQISPSVTSKSVSKEFHSNDSVSDHEQSAQVPEFIAVATFHFSPHSPANDLSYSNTLRALLPARAPPRL